MSFNDFIAYCRTLVGEELATSGGQATFTINEVGDKVVFVPTSTGKALEPPRRDRTEAVLAKLAATENYSAGAYVDESRQASYILGVMARYRDSKLAERLPVEVLRLVSAVHAWDAVRQILNGRNIDPFGQSTDYDLLTEEGDRLPPKAVFGVALESALGRAVLPSQFHGGEGTPCFQILRGHGYSIVPKGAHGLVLALSEEEFPEGMPRLRTHARRERNAAASKAKKASVLLEFGVLACERCQENLSAKYGDDAAVACIEVHHHTLAVSDMPLGYRTKLSDLQCVCANCHRVVHHELRLAAKTGP